MGLRRVSAGVGSLLVFLALAAQGVDLRFQETWGAIWGGKPAGFHVLVNAPPAAGRLVWELAAGSRAIARGERAIDAAAAAQPIALDPLVIPPVKPGVAMSATLTVSFLTGNDTQPAAQIRKPVWVLADNPFVDKSEWLKKFAIRVHAPDGSPVPDLLKKLEIPFEAVGAISDVAEIKSGVVFVAPGIAEEDGRRLAEAAATAAARGATVLWCNPPPGLLGRLPGTGGDVPTPARIEFRGGDWIKEMDKRLDANAWPPAGKCVRTCFSPVADDGRVMLSAAPDQGWPWLILRFQGGGTLVFCGYDLWEAWDTGPVPRWLLAAFLEKVTAQPAPEPRTTEQ